MNAMEILKPYITATGAASKREAGDYIKDGFLFCGKCHTAKQTTITLDGVETTVPCLCDCGTAKRDKEIAEEKERKRKAEIATLRINGLQDPIMQTCTFDRDDGQNPSTAKCKRYAEKWAQMRKENVGLILWGDTGNGKTFAAACIANAVLELGYPVLMVSFVRVLNALQGMYAEDKANYLDSLAAFPLVILDDFGAERDTSFGLEQVYSVIDTRYKQGKPLIVTTNMTLDELRNPRDMRYQRIYDRVLEMCVPIKFTGESRRKANAADKMKLAKALFE